MRQSKEDLQHVRSVIRRRKANPMRILFCNIAWMNEYKGITEEDEPQGAVLMSGSMQMHMKNITLKPFI